MLKLINVNKIEDWIKNLEDYDYNIFTTKEQKEKMKIIITAKIEAYKQVLYTIS